MSDLNPSDLRRLEDKIEKRFQILETKLDSGFEIVYSNFNTFKSDYYEKRETDALTKGKMIGMMLVSGALGSTFMGALFKIFLMEGQ